MQFNFHSDFNSNHLRYQKILKSFTIKTFNYLKIKNDFIVEVDLVDNTTIKKINREYRGINKVTDVLSFAFLESKPNEIKIKKARKILLGEIFISIDQIKKQAKELKHSFEYELIYIYVHGLLHLLGYDHVHNKKEREIMFNLEDKILEGANYEF